MHRFACQIIAFSTLAAAVLLPAGSAVAATPAPPTYTATAQLVNTAAAGGPVRAVVVVTGSRTLTTRERARTVSVKLGGRGYALARRARPALGARRAGTWQSAVLRGADRTRAVGAAGTNVFATLVTVGGRRVSIRVRLVDRTGSTIGTTQPGTGTPGGTEPGGTQPAPATPLFTPPASALEGNAAFEHFDEYFLNARFTNCVAGWPNCPDTAPVVHRYVHCSNGNWEYHRESSVSGADIHSYYTYTVTGANVAVDGSWAVSYTTSTGGNYTWQVSAAGVATGQYQFGADPAESLGSFQWAAGGC